MKKDMFRKKSLEKISSPERIDHYINAVNINTWIIAVACFIVISGLVLWGIFGKVEISEKAVTICKNKNAICYIDEKNIEDISKKTEFYIEGNSYSGSTVSEIPDKVSDVLSDYEAHLANYEKDAWIFSVKIQGDFADGIYETKIIKKSISPIFLLMN